MDESIPNRAARYTLWESDYCTHRTFIYNMQHGSSSRYIIPVKLLCRDLKIKFSAPGETWISSVHSGFASRACLFLPNPPDISSSRVINIQVSTCIENESIALLFASLIPTPRQGWNFSFSNITFQEDSCYFDGGFSRIDNTNKGDTRSISEPEALGRWRILSLSISIVLMIIFNSFLPTRDFRPIISRRKLTYFLYSTSKLIFQT